MQELLEFLLKRFISVGNLLLITPGGMTLSCGDGSGTLVVLQFRSRVALCAVLFDPELKFGEAYMDGDMTVERGSIADALEIVLGQPAAKRPRHWMRVAWLFRYLSRRISQSNTRRLSRSNVVHHYDLNESLYRLFLDADRQYSCAYFEGAEQSLDDAQLAKKRHLAAKLVLQPNQQVLEIGCGWGGLALYLARF